MDSLVEGDGFELPVPRGMQGRPKAIIAGFGRKPPSLDYLRLPSVEITEGGPKRYLGTEALSRAEPEVRIHFPPAESLQTIGSTVADRCAVCRGTQWLGVSKPTATAPNLDSTTKPVPPTRLNGRRWLS